MAAIFACYHADEGITIDSNILAIPALTTHTHAFTIAFLPAAGSRLLPALRGAPRE